MPNQIRKSEGVLRCRLCGEEAKRVPKGLYHGFPRHCGEIMQVVTPAQLAEERAWAQAMEREAANG